MPNMLLIQFLGGGGRSILASNSENKGSLSKIVHIAHTIA
jgi:hypothetical protein